MTSVTGVVAVDVGGMTTHAATARDQGYHWATCADTGTSYGLAGVLARVGVEGLARYGWMILIGLLMLSQFTSLNLLSRLIYWPASRLVLLITGYLL